MIGGAVFQREAITQGRRKRTYVFQVVFLLGLVLVLLPLWPWPGSHTSGAMLSSLGSQIFEYGTYFELLLIALVAPALTAGAIAQEKAGNTLDLLLLTRAGPFSIVFGKLLARIAALGFVLFLSVPIIFALLTLGGIDARSIVIAFTIILSLAWLGCALGIFFSTILKKATIATLCSYVCLATMLGAPVLSRWVGAVSGPTGASAVRPITQAYLSPFFDLDYLFRPTSYVVRESFARQWWVNPCLAFALGLVLASLASLLLRRAREIDRTVGVKPLLDRLDALLVKLMPGRAARALTKRPGPEGNPIYWKETNVNTLGRFRHWWRLNALAALLLFASYGVFQKHLGEIEFHQVVGGILSGFLVLTATLMAATSVAKEREERTLFVLATTPVDCSTYVRGKALGILRNLSFVMLLPFIHVLFFIIQGTIGWPSLIFVALGVPIAAISAIVQGMFVSLVLPSTLRSLVAAVALVALEATVLPFCCCLSTFNPVLLLYVGIQPPGDAFAMGSSGASPGKVVLMLFLSCIFSLFAHVGLTAVVYSLIRSGFDRYIGRAP